MTRKEKIEKIKNATCNLNREIDESHLENGVIIFFDKEMLFTIVLDNEDTILVQFNVMTTHLLVAEIVDALKEQNLDLIGFDVFYLNPHDEELYEGEDAINLFNEIVIRGEQEWKYQ